MVLRIPQGHEGSEYVLKFEIYQREGGFYSLFYRRTDRITDRRTEPPSTVFQHRYITRGTRNVFKNTLLFVLAKSLSHERKSCCEYPSFWLF